MKKTIKKESTSVDEMFREMEEEERKHPVRMYLYRLFWRYVRLPGDVRRHIKYFIQRGKRGFADCDIWNFSYYLSDVIAKGLQELKENGNGFPSEENMTEGKWVDILNEMINTFETSKEIVDMNTIYLPSERFTKDEYHKQMKFVKKFNKKHDENMVVLTKEKVRRYERGFKLFIEYFHSLWD